MSNITEINGSVAVGFNATIGNRVTANGDVTLKHDLKVEGWLDAPNVKGNNKGVFSTLAALNKAYDSPESGWVAGVVNGSSIDLYVVTDGVWTSSGNEYVVEKGDTGKDAFIEEQKLDDDGNRVIIWNDGTYVTIPKGVDATIKEQQVTETKTVIEWNDGKKTEIPNGVDGDTGTTFTPSVDEDGNISWSNDGGKENPDTMNIRGPKGDKGGLLFPEFVYDVDKGLLIIKGEYTEEELNERFKYDTDTGILTIKIAII